MPAPALSCGRVAFYADIDAEIPVWGFAGSPLVMGDIVIVAVSGALVAYDLATGDPRWFGPVGGVSYSSPHLLTIDGVEQVLMPHETGVGGVAVADGALLWEHPWPGFRIVQPALTAGGDVLISSERNGTRRIAIAHGPDGWKVEERWTSNRLKPYFSDFVVHEGHAYGFDGGILASIDLGDGERNWKGGRYGHGQLVLLPDQDLLLVVSERGELALVAATPEYVHRAGAAASDRGEDVESPGAGRQPPAGSQQPGNGRIPVGCRGRLNDSPGLASSDRGCAK